MSTQAKWQEYRRIRDLMFSICWDCPKPCPGCREWARCKAFGTTSKHLDRDDLRASEDWYRVASKMERDGLFILAEVR